MPKNARRIRLKGGGVLPVLIGDEASMMACPLSAHAGIVQIRGCTIGEIEHLTLGSSDRDHWHSIVAVADTIILFVITKPGSSEVNRLG